MKLSRVEIYGFKSFPQRTELTFDQGITGIVGPNGSGKSNIADAVRWVLGEQSARILRGAKMEDVIFNGTQTRKPMPYCEVSLIFDNEDRSLNSPFAEVQVTRRVYRSGEGEYFLNRNNCRLRDVLELFRDTGIGKEGYSIIGQGRIEEILSNKSDERRQAFEEAAGIVTYRVRKEEAERKLNRTRENLVRVNDLLDEITNRLGPLEEQARTAQEFLALSESLRGLEANAYLIRHDRLRARLASLQELMDGLQAAISGHETGLQSLTQQRQALEQRLEQSEEKDRAARQALNAAQEAHHRAQSRLQAEEATIASLQADLSRLAEKQATDQQKRDELRGLFDDSEQGRQTHDRQQQAADVAMRLEDEKLSHLLAEAETAERKLDDHKQMIIAAITRLSDAKSMQARQQAMLTQMEARMEELTAQQGDLTREVEDASANAVQADAALVETQRRLESLQSDQTQMEAKLRDAREDAADLARRVQALAVDIQACQSRLSLLQDLSRDYEGYQQAVKMALRHAKDNSNVHGVIARLIDVPKAYETALDMILGGTLQHIVTEDEETAKELIDYLRNNRLGRTTFLPISAIRPRILSPQERQLLTMPGCLGVASELISYDTHYQGVIQSILGRTVLVEDLDSGIALSRKGRQAFNVVTLAGDVLRAGGAMTGGTSQSRATSLLGREREIKELSERLAADRALLTEQEQQRAAAEEQLSLLQRLHAEALESMNQQRIAVARDQERAQRAHQEAEDSRQQQKNIADAFMQLEQAVAEIRADLQNASQLTQTETVDQQALEEQTGVLQQVLTAARKIAEDQRTKVAAAQANRAELLHQADLLQRDRARWQREMDALSAVAAKNERENARLIQEMNDAKQSLTAYQSAAGQAAEDVARMQAEAEQVAEGRASLQAKQKACMSQTEQLHAQSAQDNDKLHRNELVSARTESELQALSDYMFNSYELTYASCEPLRVEGKFDLPKAELEIKDIKQRIREMGSVNVGAVEEYALTRERHDNMSRQRDDAEQAERDLSELIDQLLRKMEAQFVTEFAKLNEYFKETFARLFGGGKAELLLADPSSPLTCDIEVAAQPPGKKLQLISLLSGGEKALTAIAILFAMLKLKPTPFCILDEIEAALDEANITYFADYLSEYAKSTQFIVITHRKGTMERCNALYGVAMEEKGVSGMVSVNLQQYAG